jgi:hypothetical protein
MRDIAVLQGFEPATLLQGEAASFKRVDEEIKKAAVILNETGGIFLFTFAGHGCPIPDTELNLVEEPDLTDETIVLFDHILLDDYLRRVLWPLFNEGVRIVGVLDSCHSATSFFASMVVDSTLTGEHLSLSITSEAGVMASVSSIHTVEHLSLGEAEHIVNSLQPAPPEEPSSVDDILVPVAFVPRELSQHEGEAHIAANKSFYDDLKIPTLADAPPIRANILLLAACRDNQQTPDGFPHGAFTTALIEVWNGGKFTGTYADLRDALLAKFANLNQTPVLTPGGQADFSGQRPFSI